MDEMFRFMTLRPAQRAKRDQTVPIAARTEFQNLLAEIRGHENPVAEMIDAARSFTAGGNFVKDPSGLPHAAAFDKLSAVLAGPPPLSGLASIQKAVEASFGKKAADLVKDEAFQLEIQRLFDSIIAVFLVPRTEGADLDALAGAARLVDLIRRAAASDPSLDEPAAAADALQRTLRLPETIFPVIPNQVRPAGVGDVLVVKQHIKRYELGEVEHFENVLVGETRKHTAKHALTTDRTVTNEREITTETTDERTVTERFELKNEAESVLKEDTSVKAGLATTAKYGTVLEVKANVDVSYSQSKSETSKLASTFARDVTTRAAKKVTDRVREQVTVRTTETFEETDEHGFDNTKGTGNVVGVYQWVNKVYEAQVFKQKGQRLLFDLTVPEPAAFLHDARESHAVKEAPVAPDLFNLSPADLGMTSGEKNYYGSLATKYQAAVEAPPADHIVVAKAFQMIDDNDGDKKGIGAGEVLDITSGYMAKHIKVNGIYNSHADEHQINVFVGPYSFECKKKVWALPLEIDVKDDKFQELFKIPVAISTSQVSDFTVNVEVACVRTPAAEEVWRVKTHAAILAGYLKLYQAYLDEVANQKFAAGDRPAIGGNPDLNRRIERTELKKGCLGVLTERVRSLLGFNAIVEDAKPPLYPRPADTAKVIDQGGWIRFFEEAFEWEHMVYVFYPYFWGRKGTWYDRVLETHDDPQFADFLAAGEARVVVPVRKGFDRDMLYFLMTGQVWSGGGLPSIGDKDYVDIVDEIKEATGGADEWDDTYPPEPWEITVPTSLVKLRLDGAIPKWERKDLKKWEWSPKPADS